jgi:hypothetical protein
MVVALLGEPREAAADVVYMRARPARVWARTAMRLGVRIACPRGGHRVEEQGQVERGARAASASGGGGLGY